MFDIPGLSTGDFHGFPSLLIQTPFSHAAISLFGGQLLSFVPSGGEEVMWLSPWSSHHPLQSAAVSQSVGLTLAAKGNATPCPRMGSCVLCHGNK